MDISPESKEPSPRRRLSVAERDGNTRIDTNLLESKFRPTKIGAKNLPSPCRL